MAQARQLRGDDVFHTFSADFGDPTYDEQVWARRVAGLLGTEHHEVPVRVSDFDEGWEVLTRHLDAPVADPTDRMLREEVRHALPDSVLEHAVRMSVTASVELRPALLDHHLVELAHRLPASVKVRAGTTKWVVREVARRLLPDDVVNRPQHSMRVPLDAWFRGGLRESARERLTGTGSWVASTFDPSLVREVVAHHERGAGDGVRLWRLMCLEMWHESYFGTAPSVPRPRGGHRPVASPGGIPRR